MTNRKFSIHYLGIVLSLASMVIGCAAFAKLWTKDPLLLSAGPYSRAMLILSAILLIFGLDWAKNGLSRQIILSWVVLAIGAAGMIIISIWTYLIPASPWSIWVECRFFVFVFLSLLGVLLRVPFPLLTPSKTDDSKILFLSVFCLSVFALIPILRSGFCWDDAFFSAQIPSMRVTGDSIFALMRDEIVSYMQRGRFNPFATFQFLTFYFLPNRILYKLLLVSLTLLNVALFDLWLRRFFRSAAVARGILLILPLCFQLRLYHDPLTSYYGLMQMMFAELILSLLFLLRYLDEGEKYNLWLSVLFFMIGLMSYEMFFPLLALFPLVIGARRRSIRQSICPTLPFLISAVALASVTFLFRSQSGANGADVYRGTAMQLDIPAILRTWGYQMAASFPFAYRLSGNDGVILKELIPWRDIFPGSFSAFFAGLRWEDGIAVALSGFALWQLRRVSPSRRLPAEGWLFGTGLLLCSSFVIALSEKYQEQIIAGLGYIPVYFGYFAAAVLAYGVFAWAFSKMGAALRWKMGWALFAIVYCFNQQANRNVTEKLNEAFRYPREVAESALQAGILKQFDAEQSLLVLDHESAIWESGWGHDLPLAPFYALHDGRLWNLTDVGRQKENLPDGGTAQVEIPPESIVFAYDATANGGFAKTGKLIEARVRGDQETLVQPVAKEIVFFLSGEAARAAGISWTAWDGSGQQAAWHECWLLADTPRGKLYKLNTSQALLFDSFQLIGVY